MILDVVKLPFQTCRDRRALGTPERDVVVFHAVLHFSNMIFPMETPPTVQTELGRLRQVKAVWRWRMFFLHVLQYP